MYEIVRNIVAKEFNTEAISVEEIIGKGKNNLVFKVVMEKECVILRMRKSHDEIETYQKEKWCAEVAGKAGIPTPEILKTGLFEEYAFSFQEYIEGVQGMDAKEKLPQIWHALGEYAKVVNQISAPELALKYTSHIETLFAEDFFTSRNIFSQELSLKIKNRLEETIAWEFAPTLCHGNLHPSNIIFDTAGVVHLIDWETATGNRTPQSELAEIYTWNTGKDNIQHFLNGYGLDYEGVERMMRDIQTLVLLRRVDVIRRKVIRSNEWMGDAYIHETVTTLAQIDDYQEDTLFTKNL